MIRSSGRRVLAPYVAPQLEEANGSLPDHGGMRMYDMTYMACKRRHLGVGHTGAAQAAELVTSTGHHRGSSSPTVALVLAPNRRGRLRHTVDAWMQQAVQWHPRSSCKQIRREQTSDEHWPLATQYWKRQQDAPVQDLGLGVRVMYGMISG